MKKSAVESPLRLVERDLPKGIFCIEDKSLDGLAGGQGRLQREGISDDVRGSWKDRLVHAATGSRHIGLF